MLVYEKPVGRVMWLLGFIDLRGLLPDTGISPVAMPYAPLPPNHCGSETHVVTGASLHHAPRRIVRRGYNRSGGVNTQGMATPRLHCRAAPWPVWQPPFTVYAASSPQALALWSTGDTAEFTRLWFGQ